MSTPEKSELRKATRWPRHEAISWRPSGATERQVGMLLESSRTGLAFAWRGHALPAEGHALDMQLNTRRGPLRAQKAIVRRVTVVHQDLAIIAAEFTQKRSLAVSSCLEAKAVATASRRALLRQSAAARQSVVSAA
jgi:hypothetical protein